MNATQWTTRLRIALAAAAAVCLTGIETSACWFTQDTFNDSYIASVNSGMLHYKPTGMLSNAQYYNGMMVDMPLTVYVKVSPRANDPQRIMIAELQYKILPAGDWVTVKRFTGTLWNMQFNNPVALFGRNTINIENIDPGTTLMIRLYLSDGIYETGDLDTDLNIADIPENPTGDNASSVNYAGGWTAPFVMYVTCTGSTRPHRN